ncbi:MAG: amidohydrolase family protein, partial [Candidatus Omnitrophica bacterium]|nr:amidohydrolase family protein [Candidatus Omnitrophota bacterium]
MIIDAHSHWLPEEIIKNAHFFSGAWGDIESQLKAMAEAGIARAVLSYPTSDAHLKLGGMKEVARIYNDNVAGILKRYPDKFIGAAVLPVSNSQEMLAELDRAQDLGFQAISLATSYNGTYIDDNIFLPIYRQAQEENIPIFVHSQIVNPIGFERVEDPLLTPVVEYIFDTTICIGKLLMSGILRDYPEVKFIFAYFGGVVCHLTQRFEATYNMLKKINFVKDIKGAPSDFLKNIYVDTSGDSKKTNFLAALELLGPEHILWGSDWPAKKDIAGSINAVRDLDISATDK